MDIYWDQVRKTLSSLEYNRLFLRGLGVFYIKPWALEKKLKSNSSRVSEYMDNPSNYGLQKMNDIFKENIKLEAVKARELEENEIKFKKRDERRNQNLEGEG